MWGSSILCCLITSLTYARPEFRTGRVNPCFTENSVNVLENYTGKGIEILPFWFSWMRCPINSLFIFVVFREFYHRPRIWSRPCSVALDQSNSDNWVFGDNTKVIIVGHKKREGGDRRKNITRTLHSQLINNE